MKKFFNKYKIKKIQIIKQKYKYIYFFRYNNISNNNLILIKKKIKKLNLNSLILKQNIIKKEFSYVKGQGCLLIIYSNYFINLIDIIKLDLIFLKINENIYSKRKLKKILISKNYLNKKLINPFINFLYFLKNIKKVNIT